MMVRASWSIASKKNCLPARESQSQLVDGIQEDGRISLLIFIVESCNKEKFEDSRYNRKSKLVKETTLNNWNRMHCLITPYNNYLLMTAPRVGSKY